LNKHHTEFAYTLSIIGSFSKVSHVTTDSVGETKDS